MRAERSKFYLPPTFWPVGGTKYCLDRDVNKAGSFKAKAKAKAKSLKAKAKGPRPRPRPEIKAKVEFNSYGLYLQSGAKFN